MQILPQINHQPQSIGTIRNKDKKNQANTQQCSIKFTNEALFQPMSRNHGSKLWKPPRNLAQMMGSPIQTAKLSKLGTVKGLHLTQILHRDPMVHVICSYTNGTETVSLRCSLATEVLREFLYILKRDVA